MLLQKECTGTKISRGQRWIREHLIDWMDANPLLWPLAVSHERALLQGGDFEAFAVLLANLSSWGSCFTLVKTREVPCCRLAGCLTSNCSRG